jgi:hypothetical protein
MIKSNNLLVDDDEEEGEVTKENFLSGRTFNQCPI